MVKALGIRHWLQTLLALGLLAGVHAGSPFTQESVHAQSPRQVWYPLDNGLEFGSLPLPSFRSEEDQRAIIITSWQMGSQHDPQGLSGRTHFLAEVLRRAHRVPTAEGEIRVGNQRTWWVEQVPPADVEAHLNKIVDRLEFKLTDASLVGRVRGDLLAAQKQQLKTLVPGLQDRVLDRLLPQNSGARGQYQLGPLSLEDLEKLRQETFTPANLHIAIVGPHDPAPTLEIARRKLARVPAGKPVAKVTPKPALFGDIGVKKNLPQVPGAIVRSWRVPSPGTKESLALGLFIPRVLRILQTGPSSIDWDPTVNPELLTITVPIAADSKDPRTALLEARARLDAAIRFGLQSSVELGDMQIARESFGGLLGIARVHDETSMHDPMSAAEALMVQRIDNVDERQLVNLFGRDIRPQLEKLKSEYISDERSVTGIVIPSAPVPAD